MEGLGHILRATMHSSLGFRVEGLGVSVEGVGTHVVGLEVALLFLACLGVLLAVDTGAVRRLRRARRQHKHDSKRDPTRREHLDGW